MARCIAAGRHSGRKESAAIAVKIQTLQQAQEPGSLEWAKENVSVWSVRWSELARSRDEQMQEEDVDGGETSGDSTQVSEMWDASQTNSSGSSFSEPDLFFV